MAAARRLEAYTALRGLHSLQRSRIKLSLKGGGPNFQMGVLRLPTYINPPDFPAASLTEGYQKSLHMHFLVWCLYFRNSVDWGAAQ
jgi:hypothetical protein